MRELNGEQVKSMLLYVAERVIDSKDFLTEVDSRIGDGDHGIGMERGMKNAREKLLGMGAVTDVYAPFFEMGRTMLMTMGGASGVIFGTMFSGGAKGKTPQKTMDCPRLAELMCGSLAKIKERGQAQPGDKTMVDAMQPAVEAMLACGGSDLGEMLEQAASAAKQGMEATRDYQAKFGRAKSLMGRELGCQDAGATSVWIIFRSMGEYVKSL